jgi:hypothetical protein
MPPFAEQLYEPSPSKSVHAPRAWLCSYCTIT